MQKNGLRRTLAAGFSALLLSCSAVTAAASTPAKQTACLLDYGGRAVSIRTLCAEAALRTGLQAEVRGQIAANSASSAATGQVLELRDEDGVLVSRQQLAVRGDVTGTGAAGLTQLTAICRAMRGAAELTSPQLAAADFNGSGDVDLSDLTAAAQQLARAAAPTISDRVLPAYFRSPDSVQSMPVYFLNGNDDIPYISTSTMYSAMLNMLRVVGDEDLTEQVTGDGIIVYTRASGSSLTLDFTAGTMTFSSFNTFMLPSYAATALDPLNTSGLTEEEEIWYFGRPEGSFQRSGLPVALDLKARGIETAFAGRTGYLPLQTFSDFILSPYGFQSLYNGQMIAIIATGDLDGLAELYYAPEPRERSSALADFSYRELCLMLDNFYGLKEQHDIKSFDALFQQTGLDAALCGADPAASDRALYELAAGYLGDLHSSFLYPSWYTGADAVISSSNVSAAVRDYHAASTRFRSARKAAYPNGVPGYEEIGNTAFVTVDGLNWQGYDYYDSPPENMDAPDTVGLIVYAHRQIMRENSPIENVVLDLSCCGGGLADAAIYVLGWFLGTARLDVNDTMTGAQASTLYQSDVNLDGQFDIDDTVVTKNRYCLISPASFSCSNIIPAVLKGDPLVTLLGQQTGGGACFVMDASTADGSVLQLSGPMRTSIAANGSYYDIDRGIVPDCPVALPQQFYDRPALVQYIEGLFR